MLIIEFNENDILQPTLPIILIKLLVQQFLRIHVRGYRGNCGILKTFIL